MAQLIVRRLDDKVKERLKSRAKRHGRSLEAEARAILEDAAADGEPPAKGANAGLGTRIAQRFRGIGLTKTELAKFNRAIEVRRRERARFVKFGP